MSAQAAAISTDQSDVSTVAADLISRARAAIQAYENHDQARIDEAVTALAWSIYKPENAEALAELAVEDTGLGNVASKIIKNTRKTFGTLRDLMRVRTTGVVEELPERGLVKYAKPVGVVAAVCPSTNPAATPVNKAMMALKGGNAVVIAPSPAGYTTTARTVELMRAELAKCGHPEDLVQILPSPVSKELTQALMEACDLIVCTGSQNNVRRAYSSGTSQSASVPAMCRSSSILRPIWTMRRKRSVHRKSSIIRRLARRRILLSSSMIFTRTLWRRWCGPAAIGPMLMRNGKSSKPCG